MVLSAVPDRVWLIDCDGAPEGREVDLTGAEHASVRLPAGSGAVGAIGAGLLVGTPHGVYLAGEDGLRRVSTGEYVGADGDLAAFLSCDDRYVCALEVGDPLSGAMQVVAPPAGMLFAPWPRATFSPDHRSVAVALTDPTGGTASLAVVDVATGAVSPVEEAQLAPGYFSAAWSPDNRWLFFVGSSGVTAHRLGGATAELDGLVLGFVNSLVSMPGP
jgi:hypothetical protein